MTHLSSPRNFYQQRQQEVQAALDTCTAKINRLFRARLACGLLMLAAWFLVIESGQQLYWALAIGATVLFLALVRLQMKLKDTSLLLSIHLKITRDELKALEGDLSPFETGQAFASATHPYALDLDIFGAGGIYPLLNRTVTQKGGTLLAERLQDPYASLPELLDRQGVIAALATKPELLEAFRIYGLAAEEGPKDLEQVQSWFGEADCCRNHKLVQIAVWLMPVLSILFLALTIMNGFLHPGLLLVVIANWVLLTRKSSQTKRAFLLIGRTARLIRKYEQLLAVFAPHSWQHPVLDRYRQQAQQSLAAIQQLHKGISLLESRNNAMVGPLMNSLFLFDLQALLRLERWRAAHGAMVSDTFASLAELDVYISLAVYAFNHPEHCVPDFRTDAPVLEADAMIHPLIKPGHAVPNSFSLGAQERIYMLTGANMTGKSTFIRTVGVQIILAYLGLPVAARSFSLPLLRLYSAIRITDSVQDDVSYFKAELNRIRALMEAVARAEQPYLVLFDEPLRGTNAHDKQAGTRSLIGRLLGFQVLAIVATHDTGLSVLEAEHPGKISNYHFESEVVDGALHFDYSLKPGVSTSNNATLLMQQMGVI